MADTTIDKRTIVCSIGKSMDGNFKAILSDNSIDRDDEFMGEALLAKWASAPNQFLPMLVDHKNEVDNLIGEWNSAEIVKSNKHIALTMKPKFFDANPKAVMVKGMLEQGAQLGLSIGAIPKAHEDVDIDGKSFRKWTDAELLEGSITPIPSNRNSYMALAKSFNLEEEVTKMADEIKKQETEAVETPVEETTEAPAVEAKEETVEAEAEEAKEETPKEEAEATEETKEEETVEVEKSAKVLKSEYRSPEETTIVKSELKINSVFEAAALMKGAKTDTWGNE